MEPAEKIERDEVSVIGGGIVVNGNIEASVDLHLEGTVIGDVTCATLILGEKASIRGSVHAERVKASGLIEGSVDTKDLSVEATAKVVGDVTYSRIRIANGGIVDGRMIHRASEESNGDGGKLRLVEAPAPAKRQQEAIHIE
ncbi:MAG: polymer-forming cytoskeletal [Alphaproteobacteria bacterium]|nr:polymer-forming cytoskeletal [Alphaproteobacteria bacterium]MDB5722781.1 polymer-forming cytoskeletal [Alphaproteobacteria bacterium]